MPKLTQQQLETHLWGAANILRGRTAGQDYKTYILSLMFFKRLSDQWDYEAEEKIRELEEDRGQSFTDAQRNALRASGVIHRFTIPEGCHWADVLAVSENIGEKLTAAMRGIAEANKELAGVFTVEWNQPAPDGQGKLIANAVVSALVQHFHGINLSNANVQPDILGRAYEYLIKQFADDAGAKAGEFFTPPEVVDILIRILEPQPGERVYDPTCGSGGMLVHSADFLIEQGHRADQVRYYGQEMNWSTYAIARINMILHGLEADIRGGKSTITDPLHLRPDGSIERFDIVIANFPFSDEYWWLPEDRRTEEQAKKAKKSLGKNGFKDRYDRFTFGNPPASYGDYAFIQHIVASANETGRCGVVCPQGVLFRGQPEIEEETGEFDADGNPKIRRRKADDEYLIRSGLLSARLIDAVIALPLNIFYGAGVPACLLIVRKDRPPERRDRVLLVYAARHCRELSNKNQLRPQDIMRLLVHYHAYGDAEKAAGLVEYHGKRLMTVVDQEETEEIARITADFQKHADRVAGLGEQLSAAEAALAGMTKKAERAKQEKAIAKIKGAMEKPQRELAKRDEQIAEARKQAEEEREAIQAVGQELLAMYADPAELAKHARVVDFAEMEENEFNLNIPRYVDTFEPEEPIDVDVALAELDKAEKERQEAMCGLRALLVQAGHSGKAPKAC
jgi:type I restriction enzyme M protein